jgi:endonuclease/exonuclease/phosphatase family metal-dependent hydrolase
MKMLSWNIRFQGLAPRLPAVMDAIRDENPDIVLLQEVTSTLLERVQSDLTEIGLQYAIDSDRGAPPRLSEYAKKKLRKGYATLIASRWPVSGSNDDWRSHAPYPEAMARATVEAPNGGPERFESLGDPERFESLGDPIGASMFALQCVRRPRATHPCQREEAG